jgi:hypothetical protein
MVIMASQGMHRLLNLDEKLSFLIKKPHAHVVLQANKPQLTGAAQHPVEVVGGD